MVTKLLAAEIAAEGGVDTIIASGRRAGVLLELDVDDEHRHRLAWFLVGLKESELHDYD
jgi:glutamate 5-kinase